MLNKYNRGLAVAMLSLAIGVPAFSQTINNASLTGMKPSNLTLSINDISAEAAVTLICEHFGYTPMFHMPLTNTVSVDLANATFDEAMERVLGNTSTDYMLESGRLHVFKPRESWSRFSDQGTGGSSGNNAGPSAPKIEPTVTKIIPLGQRTAADIQKLVKELNPKVSAVHDVPTNAVIVMGPESQVAAVELLCKNIDEMDVKQTATDTSKLVKGLRYVTQTYELEHADFEEIEEELSTIIERDNNNGNSGSSAANLRDKDGNPIETEYFMMDKARRIIVVHTTMEKLAVIDSYFKAIDKPLPQVLIETTILAIDDGLDKQLGIKWEGLEGTAGYLAPAESISTNESLPGLIKYGGKWDFSTVKALIKAVESDDKSQILSKPRVITVTGKTSSIHVGDEIPYTSGSTVTDGGNSTSSVAFKEVGIKLDVTPRVNMKDNSIQLTVVPEVSQWVKDVVMGSNTVPQVSTRRAESTIKIINGETMVIGGLIESKDVESVYKVPLLSKIPYLGKAFQTKSHNNTKTNLVILVTAHVIDENNQNIVTSKGVKEINGVNKLSDSQTIAEIAQPTVDGPNIYGENVEWPREIDNGQNLSGEPVSEPARTYADREKYAKIVAEYKAIRDEKYDSSTEAPKVETEVKEEAKPIEETKTVPAKSAEVDIEAYLQERLDEIKANLNKSQK